MNDDAEKLIENSPMWQKLTGAAALSAIFIGFSYFIGSQYSFGLGLAVVACVWDKPVSLVLGKGFKTSMKVHYLMILGYLIAIAILMLESRSFEAASESQQLIFSLAPVILLFYIYKEVKQIKKLKAGSAENQIL